MRLLTSLREPNPTLHLAQMAFQPGCSGRLLTQSHLQLPPCSISLYITCGKLPAEWKLFHIVPIPKGSSRQDVRFYRPISLLPTISKCLERHIYRLLLEYLSSNQLLSDAQFGFCSGRSTVMPLLLATHQWHTALESHKQVACVFFDLRRAFDSVPHQALLNKLHNLQVPGTLLLWLINYLSNRHQ